MTEVVQVTRQRIKPSVSHEVKALVDHQECYDSCTMTATPSVAFVTSLAADHYYAPGSTSCLDGHGRRSSCAHETGVYLD